MTQIGAESKRVKQENSVMNKIVEQRTTEQQVATTSSPSLPAEYQAELDRFRHAAVQNTKFTLMGKGLRFRKGDWVFGSEKQKVEPGTRFVAIMDEACHGWIRWNADKTASHDVGKIADGFEPRPREELGDCDEEEWPIGLSGKKEDPWRHVVYLPLVSMDGEDLLTFTSDTKTGTPAFWKLIDRYAWLGRKHPGKYPVIEIQTSGYESKQFGWIPTPAFKIVSWTDRPNVPQLTGGDDDGGDDDFGAAEAADPSDEIPF